MLSFFQEKKLECEGDERPRDLEGCEGVTGGETPLALRFLPKPLWSYPSGRLCGPEPPPPAAPAPPPPPPLLLKCSGGVEGAWPDEGAVGRLASEGERAWAVCAVGRGLLNSDRAPLTGLRDAGLADLSGEGAKTCSSERS